MNRNIMIQTLRRFKVTSGYKGYYYLLDAADIISGFHTKEKPFATQNDIYIPIGEKHETSFYNVERGIRVVVDKCWKEDKELDAFVCMERKMDGSVRPGKIRLF